MLQPDLNLSALFDFASNVFSCSKQSVGVSQSQSQSESALQDGSARPCSTSTNATSTTGAKASLTDPVDGVHDVASSTAQSLHAQHQLPWRYQPEHRFPSGFWKGALDFLGSRAADKASDMAS